MPESLIKKWGATILLNMAALPYFQDDSRPKRRAYPPQVRNDNALLRVSPFSAPAESFEGYSPSRTPAQSRRLKGSTPTTRVVGSDISRHFRKNEWETNKLCPTFSSPLRPKAVPCEGLRDTLALQGSPLPAHAGTFDDTLEEYSFQRKRIQLND